ncbi:MAG: hypothetical protein WBC71_12330 [Salaquimonas sp.]
MNKTASELSHSKGAWTENEGTRIIAMWSGPRNLSTAMMRSFGARPDCTAFDEPFYAAYLQETGLCHPMYREIIADGETDPQKVVSNCLTPPQAPKKLSYQKHMTHHMVDGFDVSWINKVTNVFLIREPKRVLASYANKTDDVTSEDIGFRKQRELFDLAKGADGNMPAVIDAMDIRSNPEAMLRKLCETIDIPFLAEMLSWEPGPKPEDGIWATHWYDAVNGSTGFAPPEKSIDMKLSDELRQIEAEVLPDYHYMRQYCLKAE